MNPTLPTGAIGFKVSGPGQITYVDAQGNPVNSSTPAAPAVKSPLPPTGSVSGTPTPIPPTAPLSTLSTVPNSAPNVPSSSATVVQGANSMNALNSTITAPTPPTDPNAATIKSLSDAYVAQGLTDVTTDKIQQWVDAGYTPQDAADKVAEYAQVAKDKQTALQDEQSKLQDELAKNNADYSAALAKLNIERSNAVHAGVAQAAKAGLFEDQSSDMVDYGNAIGREYDNLENQLTAQAKAADAASNAGNDAAVAAINKDMATLLQNGLAQIEQRRQQATALSQNESIKNQTLADKELQTIPEATATKLLSLPDNVSTLTSDQLATLTGAPGYNSLIKSGMSQQDALSYVKSAATSNKQQIAQTKAATSLASAQLSDVLKDIAIKDKTLAQTNITSLSSIGNGVYATAFGNAQLNGNYTKDKITNSLNTLATYANNGDITNLKNGIAAFALSGTPANTDMFTGLQTVASTLQSLKDKVSALPANEQSGFWNGNVVNLAAKFGQSTDPKLRTIGQELSHLSLFYGKAIGGIRGAVSAAGNGQSVFQDLIPNIKEGKDLLVSDIQGFANTAADVVNNSLKEKIGAPQFSAIYGDSFIGGDSSNITVPATGTGAPPAWVNDFFSQFNK